jgi:transposase
MQLIKKVIGIDISMNTFNACMGTIDIKQQMNIISSSGFQNNLKGYMKLLSWIRKTDIKQKLEDDSVPVWFVMEATGVYYENLAYFLKERNHLVSVILPNKMKNFSKTLENKSKTDELDAVTITRYGLEKILNDWQEPNPNLKELKELLREYQTIKQYIAQIKNRMHAKEYTHKPVKTTVSRLKEQEKFFNKQLKQIEKQIKKLISDDDDLNTRIKKITQIEGVSLITALSVITETNGFALIKNGKQLASYAGLDVVQNQSGVFTGKTRISHKGNKFIRRSMYMPALAASRYNLQLKKLYLRLIAKKSSKKIALIAVARKLLILIYTIWKKNEDYVPNYQVK